MHIGAVADDITGASDLCLMLSRSGLRTLQMIGLPRPGSSLPEADAIVIALKSRTIPAADAVEMSVSSGRALMAAGVQQILFKYCSTFDSTDAGNIGPVTEALLELTGADITIACPAFPTNGRTVYMGKLFVGRQLLSESPMKDHPLTPMRDADLVRVLSRQTNLPVGLIDAPTIAKGASAVRDAMAAARSFGQRILVVDTLSDADLMTLGAASAGLKLVTGGSGIALGLAANFKSPGPKASADSSMKAPAGRAVTLAGSCSAATRQQIATAIAAGLPVKALDPIALSNGQQTVKEIADWVISCGADSAPIVFSSADPTVLAETQAELGRAEAGALVERALADIACRLQAAGFTRFVIAGGETSGAVVEALGARILEIGPEIDPGVPWTRCVDGPEIVLALKSGNFGAPNFFQKAWSLLVQA